MTTPPRIFSSLLVLSSFFASANSTYSQITIDGTLDADYGSPLAVQLAPTGFGDNTDADVLSANGSELNAAYAVIRDGHLHLFLAGNLETNFNKLEIFIDSLDGVGQNTLGASNANIDFDGLNAMAGLTFDSDFAADYYLTASGGNSPDEEFFFNFAQVKAVGDGGTGNYIGQTAANVQTATLTGGIVTVGIDVGIDNSNAGGVTATDATTPSAEDAPNVTTGIEFKIPLTEIGAPTGPVKICAFINNNTHTFLSNQVLGSLPADYANLGAPGTVDFVDNSTTTTQFFTVPWQVTNTDDNGVGSLRQTIDDAPAGSTITFDSALSGGTITLTSGQLNINKDLTIDASALTGGLTIDAVGNSRIFEITAGATVILDSLSLINGSATGTYPDNSGGAIYNEGTLTLNQATLSGNSADFGGGIGTLGTLTLNQATLSGNSASEKGGGIDNFGTLTLNQATLSGNSADFGGGIYNAAGPLTLNQATLSDNSATNGGGIYNNSGTLTLNQAIVANNTSFSAGPDIIQFGSYGPNTGVNFIGNTNDAGTIPGTILTGDPLLAPLGDYGGPTQTMPPLPGSPAIEPAGGETTSAFTTDQRGASRIVGTVVDIGAVEAFSLPLATFTDSEPDGIPDLFEGPDGPYPQLTVGTDDSAVDTDGDGSTDAEELANMTNLYDANDYFRILSFAPAAGFDPANPSFDLSLPTFPGLSYRLESTADLTVDFEDIPDSSFTAEGFSEPITVDTSGDAQFIRAVRE